MRCTGFGNREIYRNIENELAESIDSAIRIGCREFLIGDNGMFDRLFSATVRSYKREYPDITLKLVCPYMTNKLNEYNDYYSEKFDEILLPGVTENVHFKSAIITRNKWMIDQSDLVIVYTERDFGGAFDAYKYACKKSKKIIKIFK